MAELLKHEKHQIENLQQSSSDSVRYGDKECAAALRTLVETVTVYRDLSAPGAVEIEVKGKLSTLTGDRVYPDGVMRVWGSMVAEEGLEPPTRGL